jgi:hypothetical protein
LIVVDLSRRLPIADPRPLISKKIAVRRKSHGLSIPFKTDAESVQKRRMAGYRASNGPKGAKAKAKEKAGGNYFFFVTGGAVHGGGADAGGGE